jgi:hypothetical protein
MRFAGGNENATEIRERAGELVGRRTRTQGG